jgi:hypothetical protein
MAISFACGVCQAVYTVDDAKAGKKARCVKCQTLLLVPANEPEPEEVIEDCEIIEEEDAPPAVPAKPMVQKLQRWEEEFEVVEDDPPPKPKGPVEKAVMSEHALAFETGTAGGVTVYRITRIEDELYFVEAGPYFQGLDSNEAASLGAANGANAGGNEGGLIGATVGGILAGSLAGAVAALDEHKKIKAEKRWAHLARLTPHQIKAEVYACQTSFRATRDQLTDVSFDPVSKLKDAMRPAGECKGVLRFTHARYGKRKMYFYNLWEVKKAVYSFVETLPPLAVTVNLPIKKTRQHRR